MIHAQAPDILVVDDEEGHAILVREILTDAGLSNVIRHFPDGQAVLDFLFRRGAGPHAVKGAAYLVLLDIRMPKMDGIEVLRRLKADPEHQKQPIIVVTTTDDAREIERSKALGSIYLQKPIDYEKFAEAIRRLGLFTTLLLVPPANGV